MRTFSKKQKLAAAVLGAGVIAVAGGGVAYAYWTSGGAGTGSAGTTAPAAGGLTISGTTPSGLYPGGSQSLSGTFTNTNAFGVYVHQVTIAVDPAWSAQANGSLPACTAADFSLTQPAATNDEVTSASTWTGASIAMIDSGTNQDNCQSVTVPLVYTSN